MGFAGQLSAQIISSRFLISVGARASRTPRVITTHGSLDRAPVGVPLVLANGTARILHEHIAWRYQRGCQQDTAKQEGCEAVNAEVLMLTSRKRPANLANATVTENGVVLSSVIGSQRYTAEWHADVTRVALSAETTWASCSGPTNRVWNET